MKTTIIPAQVTTVEDTLVGNLTMTQVGILLVPFFIAAIIYCLFPPAMELAWYKVILASVCFLISSVLSLRFRDMVIMDWLLLILRYNIRPQYYIYDTPLSIEEDEDIVQPLKVKKETTTVSPSRTAFTDEDLEKVRKYIKSPRHSVSFKQNSKQMVTVTVEKTVPSK